MLVFLLALLARAAMGTYQMTRSAGPAALGFPDEQWYWYMAGSLHQGDGLTGEFGHRAGYMPLYPALLSLPAGSDCGLILARVGQWLVGAAGAVAAMVLATRIAGPTVGTVAGLLVGCDPGLVGTSSLLLTETLFVTLVTAWWCVGWPLSDPLADSRRPRFLRWLAAAALASACIYTRPDALLLAGLWASFVAARRRFARPALIGSLAFTAFVAASLLPWAARNRRETGEWCLLTTRSGISLYDGVRPGATGASDLGAVKNAPEVRDLSEHEWNRYFLAESWRAIRTQPWRVARLGLVKLARTWSPFLHADEYGSRTVRWAFATWSLAWYAMVAAGLVFRRRDIALCTGMLLPAVMICCVHFFYVGSVRYRLGAVPTLALLAAIGAVSLAGWMGRRRDVE